MEGASTQDAPPIAEDVAKYMDRFQKGFKSLNATVQALPEDLKFEMSMDRSFGKRLTAVQERLRALTGNLLEVVVNEQKAVSAEGSKVKSRKSTKDEDEDKFTEFSGQVQDVIDGLLEKTNIQLDVHSGKRKKSVPPPLFAASAPAASPVPEAEKGPLPKHLINANIPKPQLAFDVVVDNSLDLPAWEPTLKPKAHAMVPLGYRSTTPLATGTDTPIEFDGENSEARRFNRPVRTPAINPLHPYYFETEHLPYPSSLFTVIPAVEPKSWAETPYTYISTPDQYSQMVAKLLLAKEIAVDLEYHSTRSYSGFLCLMQISTREEDFVVDLLTLREELREDKLGGVLVDPGVVKVFHGAESDIVWLQQDFDIYVVGLFDTYHATKILEFPKHSLKFLLDFYCKYEADKRYQKADWRIRPLPEEMAHYARSDTHFLLYIFDQLRNTLIERSGGTQTLIRQVLSLSQETATKLHRRPGYDASGGRGYNGWRGLASKFGDVRLRRDSESPDYAAYGPGVFGYQIERILKRVHAWRDAVARKEDEAPFYVIAPQDLWKLAVRAPASVMAVAQLLQLDATLARSKREELFQVIAAAKAEATNLFAEDQAREEVRKQAHLDSLKALEEAAVSAKQPEVIQSAPVAGEMTVQQDTNSTTAFWTSTTSEQQEGTSSGLFGSTLPAFTVELGPSLNPSVSLTSGLFGSILQDRKNRSSSEAAAHQEAFLKIMENFVLPGTQPAGIMGNVHATNGTLAAPATSADVVMFPLDDVPAPTQPEQIPYVKPVKKYKDEVVQVSKPKKKRKRAEEARLDEGSTGSRQGSPLDIAKTIDLVDSPEALKTKKERRTPVKPEDVPEFSYANESTSLDIDEKDEGSTARKKKVKQVKKPIVDTSGFRMPPQDPQDKLSGNRARTF